MHPTTLTTLLTSLTLTTALPYTTYSTDPAASPATSGISPSDLSVDLRLDAAAGIALPKREYQPSPDTYSPTPADQGGLGLELDLSAAGEVELPKREYTPQSGDDEGLNLGLDVDVNADVELEKRYGDDMNGGDSPTATSPESEARAMGYPAATAVSEGGKVKLGLAIAGDVYV